MKRALILLLIFIIFGGIICHAESQNQVVFCNKDSYCVKLYPSLSACINGEDTDYFIFNGYCDQVTEIDENEDIALLSVLGNDYYVCTKDLSMNPQDPKAGNSFLELYLKRSIPFIQSDGTQKTIPSGSSVLILGYLGYLDENYFLVDYLGSIGLISWAFAPTNNIKTGTTSWLLSMQEAVYIAMGALYEKYGVIDSEYAFIYAHCTISPSIPSSSFWAVYVYRTVRLENEAFYIKINAIDGSIVLCEFHDDFSG